MNLAEIVGLASLVASVALLVGAFWWARRH